jgi:thioredoxin reductase
MPSHPRRSFDWTVIGAGPAGIAAVGKLLDHGVPGNKIGWIDPHFQAGDLGKKWRNVPSNTKVELFLRYLENSKAFAYDRKKKKFPLDQMNPEENCELKYIADPLVSVTNHLKGKVAAFEDTAIGMNLRKNCWEIQAKQNVIVSRNVILAIGAEEKSLNYHGIEEISLGVALDPEKLKKALAPDDVIGVFGSSHSAVLILANLVQAEAPKILNFYRSPHLYAIYMDDWILFDDTGLKGFAAKWAKKYIDGENPPNLKRILTSDHKFEEMLASCTKVIYAVGFERRKVPVLEQFEKMEYNDKTGIIAPGLFGVGIAFPQAKYDRYMNLEYRVGLWKFIDYLNEVLPIWMKCSN